ncbi:MAG: hypothetical protein A2293_10845 [Elusimicrobia bacterium RIFOXYB2_FULL_49_7]|nr:MAG: hypothetical protein A2293_10845 [Elusimicrobia bacterium RIFOXYB2_FULL_49_7]
MTDILTKVIERKFRVIGLPKNYYLGTRPMSFDVPVNILIWVREKMDRNTSDAFHYRHILCFNIQTAGQAIVDHQILDLAPGHGLLIFPFQFHHFAAPIPASRRWIFIGFEMARSDFLTPFKGHPFNLTPGLQDLLTRLLLAYADEIGNCNTQNKTPLLLALLLNEMAQMRKEKMSNHQNTVKPLIHETLSARVQRHIYAHLSEGIRIRDLARVIGLSASRLRARYRQELGISLGRTLQAIRLNRARQLLSVSEMNVSEIADACGYESVYAFSQAFKKRSGLSPLNFRKQLH